MENNEQLQNTIKEMSECAKRLYKLMTPGMTIHIGFIERDAIIVPNKKPKKSYLIVSRPALLLGIEVAPNIPEIPKDDKK